MAWKYNDSSVKKIFQAQLSVMKARLTALWHMKEPITIDLFHKNVYLWRVLPITNSLGNIPPYLLNDPMYGERRDGFMIFTRAWCEVNANIQMDR